MINSKGCSKHFNSVFRYSQMWWREILNF